MTAIDQHSQLYALGASSVRDGFDGGTHGASGVQHIVHDDDGRACNTRIEIGQRSVRARHVIAPRRNVQLEHRRCLAFDLAQLGSNALRQIDTACFHTGEQQVLRALVFFHDFERDAGQCTANAILIEYDLRFGQSAASLQKCKKMTLRHNN